MNTKLILALLFYFISSVSLGQTQQTSWLKAEIGTIGVSSTDVLESALNAVKEKNHAGLILQLDTPGGSLEETRKMTKIMMTSLVPIVVWVGPSGSRAGSAGAFITLASHVASMAPGTNIGAAHPIQSNGKKLDDEVLKEKILNDTLAFIESLAQKNNRNVEMARSFVALSTSITAEEALKNNIIDYIAKDIPTLMKLIHGKEVSLYNGNIVELSTKNVAVAEYEPTLGQGFLKILSDPNLFYLFFLAGLIGLGFEITHPGSIFPGVIGGLSLILALIATSVLPVSWGAAALILVGIIFMIAEAFVPSFGALGIGGFVGFVLGSVFLVDPSNEQGLRISWFYIIPGAIVVGAFGSLIGWLVVKSERRKVHSGSQMLVGEEGEAIEDFVDAKGKVRVEGEIWQAHTVSEGSILKGEKVKVKSSEGLVLEVEV